MRQRFPLIVLIFAMALPLLRADEPASVVIPGESRPTATRLEEADKRLAEKKFAEAVSLLQSVAEASGNDLIPLKDGRAVRARHLAHAAVARLGAKGLVLYRQKVEPQAHLWLEQATKSSDVSLFRRLVDEAFCSRSALSALTQLGDRAFALGKFDEAEGWWRLLAPLEPIALADADPDTLFYPDPPEELAIRTRAKQVLARLFRGQHSWRADLEAFRKRYPKAAGTLAGRTGVYASILDEAAVARAGKPASPAKSWPTFGGAPGRGQVVPSPPKLLERLSQLCRAGPTWRFDLEERARQAGTHPLPKPNEIVTAARQLAFHPVVVGHHAFVADARYITAYDLRTGKAATWYDAADNAGGIKPKLTLPSLLDLRYTLTAADGCLFARLGTQSIKDVRPDPRRFVKPGGPVPENTESILVCLDLVPRKDGDRRRWMVRAIDPGRKEFAVFEGAPLVADGRVHIAASRFDGDRVITAVHCYPADPEDLAPGLLWRTDVCETRELLPARAGGAEVGEKTKQERNRHHLLTLAGSRIVYCSHSGAIVALDARTGNREWAVKYPHREIRDPEDDPTLRDLAPCLFADGRLYVAPTDSERLYCLDPATGATLWQRERLDAVHLLGVGQGRLIFTTWRNPRQGNLQAGGLRAVGAEDGSDDAGWLLPDDGGGLAPFGRGLLVGDLVLWPTARQPYGVFAVRQSDGQQPDNPALLHRIPSGNLVYANGCLLAADRQTLHAFVPPEMLPDEDEPQAEGAATRSLLQRARASAARGEVDRALERAPAVVKKIDLAAPGQGGRRLLAEVRREQQDLYLAEAEKAMAAKDLNRAEGWLKKAMDGQPPRYRLAALLRAVKGWRAVGDEKRALDAWQSLLRNDELRDLSVDDGQGLPQTASGVWQRPSSDNDKRQKDENDGKRIVREAPVLPFRQTCAVNLAAGEIFLPLQNVRSNPSPNPLPATERGPKELLAPPLRALSGRGPFDTGGRGALSAEGPLAERIWSGQGKTLLSRSRQTGEVLWNKTLPFAPEWIAGLGTVVVACGKGGAAGLHVEDGKRLWIFLAPRLGRYPATLGGEVRVVRDVLPPEPLADFHLAGSRLFMVQGERRLLAVDALAGRVIWQRWAPGAAFAMPAPRGRCQVVCPVGADNLLVQASGRRWILDAAAGKVRHESPATLERWPRAALLLGKDRVCVVSDSQTVQLLDAAARKVVWTYSLSGKTTRSGEPPLAVATKDALFVVEPENIGYRLQRLDGANGKPMWQRPPLLPLASLEAASWVIGPLALYHADAGELTARSLADGSVLWRRPLGDGVWKLDRLGDALLARMDRGAAVRFRFRWLPGSLQWRVGPLLGAAPASVELIDAQMGTLVQRINLEEPSLRGTVWLEPGARSVSPSALAWREAGTAPGVSVWWDGKGLLAGCANRVKALAVDGSQSQK